LSTTNVSVATTALSLMMLQCMQESHCIPSNRHRHAKWLLLEMAEDQNIGDQTSFFGL
jgi:hypothetical protein